MSEENVEIVRRIYGNFARSVELVRDERFEDWEAMPGWELYDPDVVLEELAEIRGRFRGAGSGVETEMDIVHLFTLRDGRIVRIRGFLDRQEALEAAGRPE
jgi:hypothetical protein